MGNDKKNRDQKPKSLIRANVNAKIQSAKSAQNAKNAQTHLKQEGKCRKFAPKKIAKSGKISCKIDFLRWLLALFRICIRATRGHIESRLPLRVGGKTFFTPHASLFKGNLACVFKKNLLFSSFLFFFPFFFPFFFLGPA